MSVMSPGFCGISNYMPISRKVLTKDFLVYIMARTTTQRYARHNLVLPFLRFLAGGDIPLDCYIVTK